MPSLKKSLSVQCWEICMIDSERECTLAIPDWDHAGWHIRVLVVKAPGVVPKDDPALLSAQLEDLLGHVRDRCMSPEFTYSQVGFCLFHFGRRGTSVSLRHWGLWGATTELFGVGWYCYNH